MIWCYLLAIEVCGVGSYGGCLALNHGLDKWVKSGRSEATYVIMVALVTFGTIGAIYKLLIT